MRESPILCNGAMVRAILSGKKTQTRRTIKLAHHNPLGQWEACTSGGHGARDRKGNLVPEEVCIWHTRTGDTLVCPFGQPGDRLWVRETWYCDDYRVISGPYLKPDDFDVSEARDDGSLVYAADGLRPYEAEQPIWRSSIHMPRWACRLVLEITDVRVERLQAISDADAMAEGVEGINGFFTHNGGKYEFRSPRGAFVQLWDSTGGDWDSSPWVWVIEFKRLEVAGG